MNPIKNPFSSFKKITKSELIFTDSVKPQMSYGKNKINMKRENLTRLSTLPENTQDTSTIADEVQKVTVLSSKSNFFLKIWFENTYYILEIFNKYKYIKVKVCYATLIFDTNWFWKSYCCPRCSCCFSCCRRCCWCCC